MRWMLYFLMQFIITQPILSQALSKKNSDLIQGQFIIQVSKNVDAKALLNKSTLSLRSARSNYSIKQIMDVPLNLWLIEYHDHNEAEFYAYLKSNSQINGVVRNRKIQSRVIPDDPLFNNQWQFINNGTQGGIENADMDMEKAWDLATGGLTTSGDTIVVCIIDDGINGNHEDLKDNMWINYQEVPENGIDDDGNGYIDDYKGWNITTNNDDVYSNGGHGTPVAGIVGARGNNGKGVSGVNWTVKLMAVNYGNASEANALSSYAYAYKMRKLYNETEGKKGAFIVATNASWGINETQADEAPLWCALYDSLGSVGILSCGATANADIDVDVQGDLPTSCTSEYLISVTNINRSDVKLASAGYGRKSIDIGAYGHQVYTVTRTSYGAFGGTSGATPHVSGMVGLLYAINCAVFDSIAHKSPSTAALIAKDMIFHGSVYLPGLKDITTTGGKLNAYRSASNLKTLCQNCSPPSGIVVQTSDETMSISWAYGTEATIPVRFRKSSSNNWITISNYSKGQIIRDIQYCEEYEIQVGSKCGLLPGDYSYSKFIKSSGCCEVPKINEILTSETIINFDWISTQSAKYLLQYKLWDKNEWVDTLLNVDYFSLTNLADCTAYSFRIQATCSKYSNVSNFSEILDISTTCGKCTSNKYCEFKPKDTSDEWIESFTMAGVENVSGPSPSGYKNFAGTQSIMLKTGQKYPFEIKAGYSDGAFSDYYRIFIDLDQNSQWSADELVFQTPSAVQNEVIDSIYIPNSAIPGTSKLRIIMSYEEFDGACDDPEYEFGEVEDYCVIINSDLCDYNVDIIKILQEKASLTFLSEFDKMNIDSIRIELRKNESITWEQIIGKDTIKFIGLDECTTYQYRVTSYCDAFLSSPSKIDTIRTTCRNSTVEIFDKIKVEPNPTSDIISIFPTLGNLFFTEIRVIDISGRQIYPFILHSGRDKISLDVSTIHQGIYLLELEDTNGVRYVTKFIKI